MKRTLIILIFAMMAWVNPSFSQTTGNTRSLQNGQTVYSINCLSCHMENGDGIKGVFPSLIKSEYLSDPNKLVKIILKGIKGPIKVNGSDYNSEMLGISISDQDAADVINYVRNSWGNKYPLIKTEDVIQAKK